MKYQAVFTRYELKYLLTIEQKKQITDAMAPYMALDAFGRTTIRNIYFDTSSYRLVRHSIERPAYKEKLRIRSYDRGRSGQHCVRGVKEEISPGSLQTPHLPFGRGRHGVGVRRA
ncbi:MAG: VTC domain-containing protein [Clostridia bacterium]